MNEQTSFSVEINDLIRKLIPHIENPDLKERVKPAGCMYHRTESGFYCYTCPRLNDEDWEIRRRLHKAKRNVGK
ncbi:(2Fe-2S)-binding protein [Paenibacillus oceani]|uniref:Uncharacterized protein n=1 Tax=Paenibacillus oceani TaxID=2772510 RepID=A0A927H236_9BACL|nr:(2Fe-2S)-binding protein [Paenibacillus oceani]MBD2865400.1 hypothetical protein [Paenibacillus oceani]